MALPTGLLIHSTLPACLLIHSVLPTGGSLWITGSAS